MIKRDPSAPLAEDVPRNGPVRLGPVPMAGKPNAPKIIERQVVDAKSMAERTVAEAQAAGKKLIERAEQEAAQMRERGFEEGLEQGAAQFTEQIARTLAHIHGNQRQSEAGFIRLVSVCVEKIIGQELQTHPDVVVGIVRQALADAQQQREVIVRANPADVESLRANESRLLEALARATGIEIRPDPSVGPGGCVIGTELGTIEARLDRQIQALQAALDDEMAGAEGALEEEVFDAT